MSRYSPAGPERVALPVMRHRWDSITFLHWPYAIEQVQRHLPAGLMVEPFDGQAWVGLVPFQMQLAGPVGPRMHFPETNVRTYVVGPDGRPGVWFFSLDAASAVASAAARASWRLPYYWSRMSVSRDGEDILYRASRRTPGPRGAGHDICVTVGDVQPDVGEFDHYLTARFTLWNVFGGQVMRTEAEHPPWALRSARVRRLSQDLITAAGLPAPNRAPIVHFSEGVDVRIGLPHRARR